MHIRWSKNALDSFDVVVSDIYKKFGNKESQKFAEDTFEVLHVVANFPTIYKKCNLRGASNARQAIIHPHTSLFYDVRRDHIELLFFWFNKDNPSKPV